METNDITTRDQRVIEHFKNACENLQEISPELLADISTFIVGLEEPHKLTALNMIAEYLVSTMKVHILSLMTTFQNNAEQDDIRPENCKKTFEQVLPEIFRIFSELSKNTSIQSLDDLYALTHITGSLQTLHETTSAAMAQNSLYRLPSMYYRELDKMHLVTRELDKEQHPVPKVVFTQSFSAEADIWSSASPIEFEISQNPEENKVSNFNEPVSFTSMIKIGHTKSNIIPIWSTKPTKVG
ncbi:MAG TPA: hypothetical protein VN207_04895 [Ktedonobacteraceae bacterium]|nr:hypothetical protein [Ktedonobacteraceae bacterium]